MCIVEGLGLEHSRFLGFSMFRVRVRLRVSCSGFRDFVLLRAQG